MTRRDDRGRRIWDRTYEGATIGALWRDAPVPYATRARTTFAADGVRLLLELPVGDAKNTAVVAQGAATVVAVDSSQHALRLARSRLQKAGVRNCVLMQGDAFALPFADGQFDGVFCWDLLGHLEDPRLALKEILRVAAPGASVICNVFGEGDSTREARGMRRVGLRAYLYNESYYFKFYSESEVKQVFRGLGMTVQEIALEQWMEGPHPGYREYDHLHESWCVLLIKDHVL